MSFQLMAWAVKQTAGSGTRKAVLLALANMTNHETGRCNPKIETIARETELGDATVRRALKDLVEAKLVSRERGRRQDGSLGVYEYSFPEMARARTPPLTLSASPPLRVSAQEPGKDYEPRGTTPSESSLIGRNPSDSPLLADAVSRIYECWRIERGRSRATYDSISPARRKKIESRLKEFSEAQLVAAIRSVAADPWPERPRHDDLTVIFRSREQVERFLEMGEGSPLQQFHDYATQAVADVRRRNAR